MVHCLKCHTQPVQSLSLQVGGDLQKADTTNAYLLIFIHYGKRKIAFIVSYTCHDLGIVSILSPCIIILT